LANITGGAFSKISRLNNRVDYNLEGLPEPHGIFKQIQLDGEISSVEMYRTFNMGIGFCVISSAQNTEDAIKTFARYKMECRPVGKITKGKGRVVASIDGEKTIL
jgi:phosphoribosylformylglycinamidine cyclo-ligase